MADSQSGGGAEKARRAGNYVKNKWDSFVNYAEVFPQDKDMHVFLFLIAALILHYIDSRFLAFSPASYYIMILPYAILTLAGLFFVFSSGFSSDGIYIIGVSVAAVAIPRLVVWLVSDYTTGGRIASSVLLAAPVWLLYLYSSKRYSTPRVRKWGGLYFFVFLFFALIKIIPTLPVVTGLSPEGIDVDAAKRDLGDIFSPKKAGERLFSWRDNLRQFVNQSLGMDYFTGRVEQNKDAPLGVYLEDLRPTEPIFYEGNPVVVWANIRGKSFEGAITIQNSCYASQGAQKISGTIYPQTLELFYDEASTLECAFENENSLPEGYYTITFQSTFKFPTWGYITYTFVDQETWKAYYSQKKDIHRELDIPRKEQAIYTSGPAAIGIGSGDMPITVNIDNPRSYFFGTTLSNAWSHGEILSVESLEIRTPPEISFERCNPSNYESASESDFNVYTFSLESPEKFFTTVTCWMTLENPQEFLGTNLKVMKTFAVSANYWYILEKSTSIRVKKSLI